MFSSLRCGTAAGAEENRQRPSGHRTSHGKMSNDSKPGEKDEQTERRMTKLLSLFCCLLLKGTGAPSVPRGLRAFCQPGPWTTPSGEQHGTQESSPLSVTLSLSFPLPLFVSSSFRDALRPSGRKQAVCERRRGCWVFMEASATESLPPRSSVSVCVCVCVWSTFLYKTVCSDRSRVRVSISGSSSVSCAGETGNQQHEQHPLPVHLHGGVYPLQRTLHWLSFINWARLQLYLLIQNFPFLGRSLNLLHFAYWFLKNPPKGNYFWTLHLIKEYLKNFVQ